VITQIALELGDESNSAIHNHASVYGQHGDHGHAVQHHAMGVKELELDYVHLVFNVWEMVFKLKNVIQLHAYHQSIVDGVSGVNGRKIRCHRVVVIHKTEQELLIVQQEKEMEVLAWVNLAKRRLWQSQGRVHLIVETSMAIILKRTISLLNV